MRRLLLALALPVLLAAPAAAHGDTGTMEVVAADQLDGLQVHLEVGVLHEDGDLAEEATVTAVLTSTDGEVGPVQLPRIAGARYGADLFLPAPGSWTATITSTGPAATATATVEVEAGPGTTLPTTTTTDPPVDDDDGSSSPVGWALAAVAAAGSFIAFRRSRRRREG